MATIKFKRGATDTTGTLASGEPALNTASKKLWVGYDDTNKVWVGAEIEATMASPTSALKLTTQKGIVDYIAGLGYGTGSGDMLLGTAQTVTAAKTFNSGTLKYAGSTSGTTTLNATAVAGTTTLTLPAATDTLVGKATTDTLTNKTLTTPKIAQINDTNGLAVLKTGTTASAVNEVTITNNITAQAPHVSATGSDTNISLHLAPKGTGKYVVVENGTDGTKQLAFGIAGATTATTTYLNAAQTVDRTITLPDATDTLVGKATTDTLTNKTFNTAGTGNSFSINGTAITAVAGTGAVVLANTPTLITPNIGAATGTSLVLSGDLTVNGTTTTINSTTLTVDDKNIELGSVAVPSDVTADGGGITLKGTTDKTLNWVDATDSWTSSEHFNLLTGKAYYINGTSVLNATTLGSAVVSSSLTSVGVIATGTWQGTAIADTYISSAATWNTASTDRFKWDGGATGLTADTGRTSLGLVIGTDVQAYSATLAAAAGGTYTGNVIGNVSGSSDSCTGNAATVTDGAYVNVDNNFSAFQTLQDGLEVFLDTYLDSSLTVGTTITSGAINGLTVSFVNGTGNTVIGESAGTSLTSLAFNNVLIGINSGDAITSGDTNIAIGSDALGAAITAVDCVAVGHNALLLNTASGNIAIGARALDAVTTGTGNFAAGTDAASAINTGTNNFALGTNALKIATTVNDNVAIGKDALQGKTTSGNGNVAIGTSAMYRATTALTCTAVGYQSQFGSAAGTGQGNSSLGYNSMVNVTSASYNSAVGINALYGLTSGAQNTACGLESLFGITTTNSNTGVGTSALRNITNGEGNTGIGHSAGRYKTASGTTNHTLSGDYNLYIGYQSRASGDSVTKEVVIGGTDALGLGSNTTVIGTSTTLGNRIFGVASTGQVAPTIASAATIAPTTSIVFISGTAAIATITAPSTIATTGGQITLIPTGIFTTTAAGNIALASTAVVSKALIMTYDATTAKWYPSY